jgi:hypothetical protein
MAQHGKAAAQPFDELREIVSKITMSAQLLARYWSQESFQTAKQAEAHAVRIQGQEAVFWGSSADDDPINPKLNKVISDIEKTCRSIIEGEGSLYGFLNSKLHKRS